MLARQGYDARGLTDKQVEWLRWRLLGRPYMSGRYREGKRFQQRLMSEPGTSAFLQSEESMQYRFVKKNTHKPVSC